MRALFCLFALAMVAGQSAGAGDIYYPLLCRGGSIGVNMNTYVYSGQQGSSAFPLPYQGIGPVTAKLEFSAAKVAAGQDGAALPSGTCAFVDRPLRINEPLSIADNDPGSVYFIVLGDGSVKGNSRYQSFNDPNVFRFMVINRGHSSFELPPGSSFTAVP